MASSSFTPNLALCAWSANDKPKRTDFVNDNAKIDTAFGNHINNNSIHLTTDEKAALTAPFVITGYAGNGTASRTITLDFPPKLAVIYQRDCPTVTTDSNGNYITHFTIVTKTGSSMSDVELNENRLVVTQDTTPTDGVKDNFNESYAQYTVLLFR